MTRVNATWFLTTLKEKSNDISNENILEMEWTAPFEDCDWRDDDFILGGISDWRWGSTVERFFFRVTQNLGINLVILLVKTEENNETVIHVDADNVNAHAAEYFDDYRHVSGNIWFPSLGPSRIFLP